MDNVVFSMFNSKPLYDELKAKCHPDRYLSPEKNAEALFLFQELQKNKNNYEEMLKLKPKIEELYREV